MPFESFRFWYSSISSHTPSKWVRLSLRSELRTCLFNRLYWWESREQLRFSSIRASVSGVIHAWLGCVRFTLNVSLAESTPLITAILVRYPFLDLANRSHLHYHQAQPEAGTCYWAPADTDQCRICRMYRTTTKSSRTTNFRTAARWTRPYFLLLNCFRANIVNVFWLFSV